MLFFRKYLTLFFYCLVAVLSAQNKFTFGNSIPANAIEAEKIYLQLTGTTYNTSEVIWFKAIVVNALNNLISNKSEVLHVELIDPLDKKIIDSKLLKLEAGIANSFFQLHSNYPEGKYVIRAYTEWNKNFGTDFFFSTQVNVFQFNSLENKVDPIRNVIVNKDPKKQNNSISASIHPLDLDSLHNGKSMLYLNWKDGKDSIEMKHRKHNPVIINHEISKDLKTVGFRLKTLNRAYSKTIVLDKDHGSLVFFPEGGELVNGIKSTLGFKYLNYNGKGTKIEGRIVDQEGNQIVRFSSNGLGMGKIELLPEKGNDYYGLIISEKGTSHKFKIPKAKPEGVVLSILNNGSHKKIVLRSKPENQDSVFIKLYHRGTSLFLIKAKLRKGRLHYQLNDETLPNGIVGATVYNSNYLPICERLFYNNRPDQNLLVELEIDKGTYLARDSVSVKIRTKNKGVAISSSISLMAVKEDYFMQTNLSRRDIVSYFMLESDIRGKIENPSYYFEDAAHLEDLDYLMLTQGWSNYKYDEPEIPKIIPAEKGLSITGYVEGILNRKGKKKRRGEKYDLNMMTFGDKAEVYHQEIDETGYFEFEMSDSYGNGKKFVIQPSSIKRKTNNFKVRISERQIPEIDYKIDDVISLVDTIIEKSVSKRVVKNIKLDPFLLPNTIALNEVVVSDYILTPERENMVKLHGMPDVVINQKELMAKKENWTSRLYKWLLFNYSKDLTIKRVGASPGFLYASVFGAGFTFVVIDGIPVQRYDYSLVPDIPLEAVKSVEIFKNTATANRYVSDIFNGPGAPPIFAFPAVLSIHTYSGKGLFGAFPSKSSLLNASAPEFSPKREFYSPKHDNDSEEDMNTPDLRTLVHWEPNIITDANGKANVKFFNGDILGKTMIFCEGITISGNVGYSEISYEVVE